MYPVLLWCGIKCDFIYKISCCDQNCMVVNRESYHPNLVGFFISGQTLTFSGAVWPWMGILNASSTVPCVQQALCLRNLEVPTRRSPWSISAPLNSSNWLQKMCCSAHASAYWLCQQSGAALNALRRSFLIPCFQLRLSASNDSIPLQGLSEHWGHLCRHAAGLGHRQQTLWTLNLDVALLRNGVHSWSGGPDHGYTGSWQMRL
jgi:hypothetical protein